MDQPQAYAEGVGGATVRERSLVFGKDNMNVLHIKDANVRARDRCLRPCTRMGAPFWLARVATVALLLLRAPTDNKSKLRRCSRGKQSHQWDVPRLSGVKEVIKIVLRKQTFL